ncbi:hypothetical protein NK8_74440 (plasmid) [Caballeronia sp. NK8]|nr:hypothetical protein NK8_74440 [Caballeronia sp. NK8]
MGGKTLARRTAVLPFNTAEIGMNEDARTAVADGVQMAGNRERAGDAVLAAAHADSDDSVAREQRRHLWHKCDVTGTRWNVAA